MRWSVVVVGVGAACVETYGECERYSEELADVDAAAMGWSATDLDGLFGPTLAASGVDGRLNPANVTVRFERIAGPVTKVYAEEVVKRRFDGTPFAEELMYTDLRCHDELQIPATAWVSAGDVALEIDGTAFVQDESGTMPLSARVHADLPLTTPGLPPHAEVMANPSGTAGEAAVTVWVQDRKTFGSLIYVPARAAETWSDIGLSW
jgi:hypothetical protein